MTLSRGMDLSTKQGRREQGLRMQRAVERAGFSIEELAGRIGCSRALIYQYLAGTTLAQPDRLQQIALQCSVALTYFYEDANVDGLPSPASTGPLPAVPIVPQASTTVSVVEPVVVRVPTDMSARVADGLQRLQDLANALNSPPDYGALASTCERILTLAAQLDDQPASARAQFMLGNARLRMADFPRAAEALEYAIALARQAGDIEIETSASQSLGNALVALGRTEEARTHFARIASGQVFQGCWQGTLSLGCVHEQFGEYQQAMQSYDDAAALLEEGQAQGKASAGEVAEGLLYVNANRVNVYMDGGDFSGARPLAEKCLSDAEALGSPDQHLESRFNIAWCDFHTGHWNRAYHGFTGVIQLARLLGDLGRETLAKAWLAILLAAAGEHDSALGTGKDALSTALSRADRRAELYAQLALADGYTATTRHGEARYHANQALAVATALRMERAESECLLRLARICVQSGEWISAVEYASRSLRIARRLGARHLDALASFWLAAASLHIPLSPTEEPQPLSPRKRCMQALELAREIELADVQWRAEDLLSQTEEPTDPAGGEEALQHLRSAVDMLGALRISLIEAGLTDTLLENVDCMGVYERLVRFTIEKGRLKEGRLFLEQAGWPPLSALFLDEGLQATDS